jgi:hypothetical protein
MAPFSDAKYFIRGMPTAAFSDAKYFIGKMPNLAFHDSKSGISPDGIFGISDATIRQCL